jgi:hypothetical protein
MLVQSLIQFIFWHSKANHISHPQTASYLVIKTIYTIISSGITPPVLIKTTVYNSLYQNHVNNYWTG